MNKITEIPYSGKNHGTFNKEWLSHKKTSEWWYATGYFSDTDDKMYSYQFTVLRPLIMGSRPLVLHLALTDFASGKHYFTQTLNTKDTEIIIDEKVVQFGVDAKIEKGETGMHLFCKDNAFQLDLTLNYGKGAVWQCDDGYLLMGNAKTKESTCYYSYTNMPTIGTLVFEGNTLNVHGKSWFDKQGGPYNLMSAKTHWEWFSLRFYDDEEVMLFTFPQNNYQDGTYISKKGIATRLNDYVVTPNGFVVEQDLKFSSGWSLSVPKIKEETYALKPFFKGQMNIGYFEQLCGIYNSSGDEVGIAIVELLPGAYNKKFKKQLLLSASHSVEG